MRFELAGTMAPSGPPGPGNPSNPQEGVQVFTADATFDAKSFADQGYTAAEIICIGAGGGAGGGYFAPYEVDPNAPDPNTADWWGQRFYGGAGGGGGVHRVNLNLLLLPDSVDIKVGAGGLAGAWQNDPSRYQLTRNYGLEQLWATTDGGDGGYSSFGDTLCRASGGKGGKKVTEVLWFDPAVTILGSNARCAPHSDGGDGGIGNSIVAGGGAAGAKHIEIQPGDIHTQNNGDVVLSPAVDSQGGTWDGTIGSGGGGGSGGAVLITGQHVIIPRDAWVATFYGNASFGSEGNYSDADTSFMGPRTEAVEDPNNYVLTNATTRPVPGPGGGAKTGPYSGLTAVYGRGVQLPVDAQALNGVVIVRLTAK